MTQREEEGTTSTGITLDAARALEQMVTELDTKKFSFLSRLILRVYDGGKDLWIQMGMPGTPKMTARVLRALADQLDPPKPPASPIEPKLTDYIDEIAAAVLAKIRQDRRGQNQQGDPTGADTVESPSRDAE